MEKPRTRKFRYFGLLTIFLCSFNFAFAQNAENFKSQSTQNKTEPYIIQNLDGAIKGNEATFLLCVPNTTPREVTYIFEEPAGDVKRISIRKAAQSNAKQTDTLIEAIFVFNSAGNFKMPAITVKIGAKKHIVQLGEVFVSENPRIMPPNVFWAFSTEENGETAEHFMQGKKTKIELRASFVEHIENINFPLSENAILELSEEITKDFAPIGDAITPRGELCAIYNFTPLLSGKLTLPSGTIYLTGTNGEECEYFVESKEIFVEEYKKSDNFQNEKNNASDIFENAFTLSEDFSQNENKNFKNKASEEDLKELSALRSQERWSLLASYSRQKRIEKENELGIDFSSDEKSAIQFLIFAVIFVLFLLCAILMLFWHKIIRGVLFLLIALCLGTFCIAQSTAFLTQAAVFAGGNILTVPDENSLSSTSLKCGSRVTIKKKRGEWVLIKYDNQFSGWVRLEDLYFINKENAKNAEQTEKATSVWGKFINNKKNELLK